MVERKEGRKEERKRKKYKSYVSYGVVSDMISNYTHARGIRVFDIYYGCILLYTT